MYRSAFLSGHRLRLLALFLLSVVVAEIILLAALVPLDAAVYTWIHSQRVCAVERMAMGLKQPPILALVGVYVLLLARLGMLKRWQEVRHVLFVVGLGVLLGEVLKVGFDRARPSDVPPLFDGHSFPSGHVTNGTLLAGVLGFFVVRPRWAVWQKLAGGGALVAIVALVAWQRLYVGAHWFSDIIGSVLLTGAWLCFIMPHPALLGRWRRPLLIATALLVCLGGFRLFPQVGVPLPSVTSVTGELLLEQPFGELASPATLHGAWVVHTSEPAGPITWMQPGEASITVQLPTDRRADSLRLAARPYTEPDGFVCMPLEIVVNQHTVGRLLLYRGWREYPLWFDPAWITPGTNAVTFRIPNDTPVANPGGLAVAFLHLRFFAKTR